MRQKPFPEKTEEMLFTRYFLQSCGLGNVTLYAPSSREEYVEGYDAKLCGGSSFREIYLQFKAPIYKKPTGLFRIEITPHQHKTLKGERPPRSAFYVTHTFTSLTELQDAARHITRSLDFLLHFIAIEISGLPDDVRFFTYNKPGSPWTLPDIKYGNSTDKRKREGSTLLAQLHWFWGSKLLRDFLSNRVGAWVKLSTDGTALAPSAAPQVAENDSERQPDDVWWVSPAVIRKMNGDHDSDRSFGIMYRKDMAK